MRTLMVGGGLITVSPFGAKPVFSRFGQAPHGNAAGIGGAQRVIGGLSRPAELTRADDTAYVAGTQIRCSPYNRKAEPGLFCTLVA